MEGCGEAAALPPRVVDAGLAVAPAVAITVAITVGPGQGEAPDTLAYGLGLVIAALSLFRGAGPGRAAGVGGGAGLLQPVPLPGPVLRRAPVGVAGHRLDRRPPPLGPGGRGLVRLHPAGVPGRERPPRRVRRPAGGGAARPGAAGGGAAAGEAVRTAGHSTRSTACWWPSRSGPRGCCSTSCPRRSPPGSSPARSRSPTASSRSPCSSPTWWSSPAGAGRSARRRSWEALNELFSAFDELGAVARPGEDQDRR